MNKIRKIKFNKRDELLMDLLREFNYVTYDQIKKKIAYTMAKVFQIKE